MWIESSEFLFNEICSVICGIPSKKYRIVSVWGVGDYVVCCILHCPDLHRSRIRITRIQIEWIFIGFEIDRWAEIAFFFPFSIEIEHILFHGKLVECVKVGHAAADQSIQKLSSFAPTIFISQYSPIASENAFHFAALESIMNEIEFKRKTQFIEFMKTEKLLWQRQFFFSSLLVSMG